MNLSSPTSFFLLFTMPNKYSHGLVFSHQQHQSISNTNGPVTSRPSSSRSPTPHTHSAALWIPTPSRHSTKHSAYSPYLRLEPDPEPEPSYDYGNSTKISRPSDQSTPSNALQFESTSSERSHIPPDRLRLGSPSGFRIETLPSSPAELEPTLSKRPHYELPLSQRPSPKSTSPERLRLSASSPVHTRNSRPSLHHNSSIETQIYNPEPTISSPPTQESQDPSSVATHEPHLSPPYVHESQHVFSMESSESSSPPISKEDCRFSSETSNARVASPIRDRRQSFVHKTQALASPPLVQDHYPYSPFGTENSPLFPSARELQDYFSLEAQRSSSTPAATGARQDVSPMLTRSALSNPSRDGHGRPSLDLQRWQPPPQTRGNRRRPSLGTQHLSSERRSQTTQGSFHGRRQSIDQPAPGDRQRPPSLGPRHLSFDHTTKDPRRSWRQSIDSKTAQERQVRPSLSTQQLSLEQFIQESDRIQEPSIDPQSHSSQLSSSHKGNPNPRQFALANTRRSNAKSVPLRHGNQSRRDRPLKLPNTFASQHRIQLPPSQDAYDNVLIETHGFPPERPPSPPPTPDSSKSSSLKAQAEKSQKMRPPPPIPQRSARRSPPRQRSVSRSESSSIVYLPTEPPKPTTSLAIDRPTNSRKATASHSPTFSMSISTRRSSINATISPQPVSFPNFSETMISPRRASFSQSRDMEHFEDAKLVPLPSDVDFNVLPYEDPNAGPAIFRATQLGLETPISPRYEEPNVGPTFFDATQSEFEKSVSDVRPVSSRSSSFDSAAPPPIGLNRRISHAIAEPYQPRMPKKESKMSLLSFLRSMPAPKAVLYSEASQGKPPIPVSVSRTAAPSIPLLFPGYRGQFPPPHRMHDKGLRPGLEPRMRPGLAATRSRAPRSKAHVDAAEKRKSWVKGDDVAKTQGAGHRPAKNGELERILSNI